MIEQRSEWMIPVAIACPADGEVADGAADVFRILRCLLFDAHRIRKRDQPYRSCGQVTLADELLGSLLRFCQWFAPHAAGEIKGEVDCHVFPHLLVDGATGETGRNVRWNRLDGQLQWLAAGTLNCGN